MFYIELSGNGSSIQSIKSHVTNIHGITKLDVQSNTISFVSEIIPKKGIFSGIARKDKSVSFIVKVVGMHDIEPAVILEYAEGKLIDEQYRKEKKRKRHD